jgi:ketosteroid isomerase-like protein
MKSSPVLLFLAFLLFGFATCTVPPQETPVDSAVAEQADMDALQKAAEVLLSAVNNDDLSAFLEGVTDDVVLMPPDRPTTTGKVVLQSLAKEEFGRNTSDEDWFEDEVVVSGDWGFVRGNYAAVVGSETGEPEELSGKQLLVFKRAEDGSWKLARAIWNITRIPDAEKTVGRTD